MDSEKLLIIGCGDLGERLALALSQWPVEVAGVRRHPPSDNEHALRYIAADYADPQQLRSVLAEGFDRVVVIPKPTERSDAGYEQGYLKTCQNLAHALANEPRVKQLLLVSSTSVYGQSDGCWVNEQSPACPARSGAKYILAAEQCLEATAVPLVIVRLAGIYGPGRNHLLNQVRTGKAAPGPAYTNRIHSDDAARAMAHLLFGTPSAAGVYLVSDGQAPTHAQVVQWLAKRLGVECPPLQASSDSTSLNKRISNQRLLGTGFSYLYPGFEEGYESLIRR